MKEFDEDVYIAFSAPIGIDVKAFVKKISAYAPCGGRYEFSNIKLTKILFDLSLDNKDLRKKIESCNKLRKDVGNSILAQYAIYEIGKIKKENNKVRRIFLIDQLKRVEELQLFRETFGKNFFLISIVEKLSTRTGFLSHHLNINQKEIDELIKLDNNQKDFDESENGQQSRKVFEQADYFLENTCDNNEINRFFDHVFYRTLIPPTRNEFFEYLSFASSLMSADLSRQVGAVIVNEDGEIISNGYNDVPRFGGGMYPVETSKFDQREFKLKKDSNKEQINIIIKEICSDDAFAKIESSLQKQIKDLITENISGLTEFGRCVHAEMEAILSAMRKGYNLKNSILYVTTFPCHNCAKHIVSSGIKEVFYIQEYPKSKALELHTDSIHDSLKDSTNVDSKVLIKPFLGVGPRRFADFFSVDYLSAGDAISRKDKETDTLIEKDVSKIELRFKIYKFISDYLIEDISLELKEKILAKYDQHPSTLISELQSIEPRAKREKAVS